MPPTAKPLRILVVEDHAPLRAQIAGLLQGAGWHVEEASDGRLGLRLALEQPPDVLLLGGLDPRVQAVLAIVPPHRDNKEHSRFDSGHLLPAHCVDGLAGWF